MGVSRLGLWGTVEFFPEEGKYHLDGHRNCGVCLTPGETEEFHGICPVCGKKITIGVAHRVEDLARRPEGEPFLGEKPFVRLAPLAQVIAGCLGKGEQTKTVQGLYEKLLAQLGPELFLLREGPLGDVEALAGERVRRGLERLRAGELSWEPGYDGVYGKALFP